MIGQSACIYVYMRVIVLPFQKSLSADLKRTHITRTKHAIYTNSHTKSVKMEMDMRYSFFFFSIFVYSGVHPCPDRSTQKRESYR
jgi:hypothetical protein